jgi:hypothetical protein
MKHLKYLLIFVVLIQAVYIKSAFAQSKDFIISSDTVTVGINEVATFESLIENLLDEELEIYHITLRSYFLSTDLSDFAILNPKFTLKKKGEEESKNVIEIIFKPSKIYKNECLEMFVYTNKSEGFANLCINMSTTNIVDNFREDEINIIPNPASDFINIQFQTSEVLKTSEVSKVQIFDILGLEVISVGTGLDLSSNGLDLSTLRIDVSHLPSGVYFIRIGDRMEKFVKM